MNRCFGCTGFGNPMFATLSRAAAKSAASRLRDAGVMRTDSAWLRRLAVCRDCPLRTVVGGIAHCGRPLLQQIRRSVTQGCGCPLEAKAKTPDEHCPLTRDGRPARQAEQCECRWCREEPRAAKV